MGSLFVASGIKIRGPAFTLIPVHKAPTNHKEGLILPVLCSGSGYQSLSVGVLLL